MKVLINNTEQIQPDGTNETLFKLYGRQPDNPEKVEEITVRGLEPYFYAPEEEARTHEDYLLRQDSINRIEYDEYDAFNSPETLAKIVVPYPQDTREARELFDTTYEADVPFTRRLRIDTGMRAIIEVPRNDVHYTEIKPVEPDPEATEGGGNDFTNLSPRVVTIDIEVDDSASGFPEQGRERVLSIVAHDSYTDETVGFLDTDGRDIFDWADVEAPEDPERGGRAALGVAEFLDELHLRPDERQLLIDFACYIDTVDPDIITGWNVDDFDAKYLIQRMDKIGVNATRMSRLDWTGITNRGEPRIKGRTIYDLLTVYDLNTGTELPSKKLDDIAQRELDEQKIEFNGSYRELYEDNIVKFLKYNARDVELTYRINESADTIQFRDLLRRQVGVDFEDSYYNKDFVDMMCRRKLKQRGQCAPTKPDYEDIPDGDFEGGFVLEPHQGIAENVIGLDLASLYPYTMAMLNASPETIVESDAATSERVIEAAGGTLFKKETIGLFPSLVEDGIQLKAEYKELRDNATDEEYEHYANLYLVAKTITNSLYGVTGWEAFFLYDEAVAEAVTLTGQAVLKRTANYVEETGFNVIYGDTDSVYVEMPDTHGQDWCVERARVLEATLNTDIYPGFARQFGLTSEENLWEIEVEVYMERYFQYGKKKRYAYLATWKNGSQVEDPEPTIVGSTSKRSDSSKLTSQLEEEILDAVFDQRENEIGSIIYDAAKKINNDDKQWELIGIPMGFGQELDEYDNPGAHVRGALVARELTGKQYGKGDKPMRCYIEPTSLGGALSEVTDVICYESASDIRDFENNLRIDVQKMTNTIIVKPLGGMLNALDIDAGAAVRGQSQTGLGAF